MGQETTGVPLQFQLTWGHPVENGTRIKITEMRKARGKKWHSLGILGILFPRLGIWLLLCPLDAKKGCSLNCFNCLQVCVTHIEQLSNLCFFFQRRKERCFSLHGSDMYKPALLAVGIIYSSIKGDSGTFAIIKKETILYPLRHTTQKHQSQKPSSSHSSWLSCSAAHSI